MKAAELKALMNLSGNCSYSADNKAKFRRLATKFLREVAAIINDNAEVRFNPGGIADLGDAILHGDHVYVNFTADHVRSVCGPAYYRKCKGKKDYSGERNNWLSWGQILNGPEFVARLILNLIDIAHQCPRCSGFRTQLTDHFGKPSTTQVYCKDCEQVTWTLA